MAKFINYEGKRFGNLVVIKRLPNNKNKVVWLCKCDCGNICEKTSAKLRYGYSFMCDNCLSKIKRWNKKEHVGEKFGTLEIIGTSDRKTSSGSYYQICKCECGKIKEIEYGNLKSGSIISCGECKKYNQYDLTNDYGVCTVSNGNKFLFDKEYYDKISKYIWSMTGSGYYMTTEKTDGKYMLLHRLIMDCPNGMVVDHINHNKSDNRKSNLRICTNSQNAMNSRIGSNNTSGTKGVYYSKSRDVWIAFIIKDGKRIFLGYFKNIKDAIKTRKNAEIKYFGEFRYKEDYKNE